MDYSARYRAQPDFLTRTGVIPQERAPPLPAIYQESQAPLIRVPLCPILPYAQ